MRHLPTLAACECGFMEYFFGEDTNPPQLLLKRLLGNFDDQFHIAKNCFRRIIGRKPPHFGDRWLVILALASIPPNGGSYRHSRKFPPDISTNASLSHRTQMKTFNIDE